MIRMYLIRTFILKTSNFYINTSASFPFFTPRKKLHKPTIYVALCNFFVRFEFQTPLLLTYPLTTAYIYVVPFLKYDGIQIVLEKFFCIVSQNCPKHNSHFPPGGICERNEKHKESTESL